MKLFTFAGFVGAVSLCLAPSVFASHAMPLVNLTQANSDATTVAWGGVANSAGIRLRAASDSPTCGGSGAIYHMDVGVMPNSQAFKGTNYTPRPHLFDVVALWNLVN